LLQRVAADEIPPAAALKKIRKVAGHVEKVQRLLRNFGNVDEHAPLNRRYAQVMAQAIDLSDEVQSKRRSELMFAMDELMKMLHRDFIA
jgi:hypothetical protein